MTRAPLAPASALLALLALSPCTISCGDEEQTKNCPKETPPVTANPLRPTYHLTPPSGWMNDPCGLIHHRGKWHLFYQYNPTIAVWGNIHWGHAVSEDLVTWKHLSPALKPDPQHGMIFTGSAVLDGNNSSGLCKGKSCLVAVYTHAQGKTGQEFQSIAVSDDGGATWAPYKGNPVIPNPGIKDFRDPRVFWHAPSKRWVMALAAGDHAAIYTSTDLKSWKQVSVFGPIKTLSATPTWECPELFPLPAPGGGERWVFKIDLNMGMGKQGNHGRYWLGSFDGKSFKVSGPSQGARLDGGEDFYAAQLFSEAPGGRRLWVGWIGSWQYGLQTPTKGWRGAMSIPRELALVSEGGEEFLVQAPSPELLKLRGGCDPLTSVAGQDIDGESGLLKGLKGTTLELVLEFDLSGTTEVGLRLLDDGKGGALIVGYDAGKQELFLDRRKAGDTSFHAGFPARHTAALKLTGGKLKLRIFLDRSTVEVFANGGRAVITDLVFPREGATGFGLYSKGTARLEKLVVFSSARQRRPSSP